MLILQVVVEACDPTTAPAVTYDASYSSDLSGHKLVSLVWAQESTGAINPVLDDLISQLNSRTGDVSTRTLLRIPQAAIAQLDDGSYTLTVTVVNFLNKAATARLTFNKQPSGAVPVVSIVGGQSQSFKVAEGIRVSSYLQASSVCGGKEVGILGQLRVKQVGPEHCIMLLDLPLLLIPAYSA